MNAYLLVALLYAVGGGVGTAAAVILHKRRRS